MAQDKRIASKMENLGLAKPIKPMPTTPLIYIGSTTTTTSKVSTDKTYQMIFFAVSELSDQFLSHKGKKVLGTLGLN